MTDLIIKQGTTFSRVLRWESPTLVYAPITAIAKAAPAVITAVLHGISDGWRVAVQSVQGMTQINAQNTPPKAKDYYPATVRDANTVELNSVNAAEYSTYTSGGYLQYNKPVDLTGFTARMSIKDRIGGTELLRLDTTTGGITISAVNHTITLAVSATATAAITWKKGVYDLEMVSAGGIVTTLISGNISVTKEVTT